MAIKQLTEEQVLTMTPEEKDQWWLDNVYQGDVRQMTPRVIVGGFIIGGVLSITNLYVGARAGWSLGVAITSVILAFVFFKALSNTFLGKNYHVLESNILQSIACNAGYMNGPLIASMAAYMMITNQVIPWWQMAIYLVCLSLLGVFFAFPLKRRFINVEQMPFPEGRAAGVVMDTLHSEEKGSSVLPAKLLIWSGVIAAVVKFFQSHNIMEKIKLPFLTIPELLDNWYYALAAKNDWFVPGINGIPLKDLTIRPSLDLAMIGAGGLMGIATGFSLMIGAAINYCVLAPIMVGLGDIAHTVDEAGVIHTGFRNITTWSLWCGVAMMTTASLLAFFANPQMIVKAFAGLTGKKQAVKKDVLKEIELPMKASVFGVIFVGTFLVFLINWMFGVDYWMGIIAIPMVFIFTLIGVNSTALTSITPTGALGKLTQLTYGAIAPGNIKTNIVAASVSAEVAGSASNLIQNIKPGYMLGGKPRLQAIGHVIGAFSGALFSVGVFYPLFLKGDPNGLITNEYPYPAATIWKSVAEILTKGLSELETTAMWAAVIGAVVGILFEGLRLKFKGKIPISPVGIGLAFVIPFDICLSMFFGAFVFWVLGKKYSDPKHKINATVVQNQESICAGVIAGAALMAVAIMALETFVLN